MLTRRHFLQIGLAIGVLLTCAPMIGMFGAMIRMTQVFRTLGQSGIGDPRPLSTAIAHTLLASAGGFVLFPAGIVLLIVCGLLLRQSRQSPPPPLPRFPENFAKPPDNH